MTPASPKKKTKVAPKAKSAKAPAKRKSSKPRAPSPKRREQAAAVWPRLEKGIPDPHVELRFKDPWELMVAVILSAQSTDKMVNHVMPSLLARWPTPKALGDAPQEEVETVIKSTGFFRNKSKAIREASRAIVERFGGKVPRTMEEMLTLPGVARKSANVVLGAAYGVRSGMAIDTHAMRVSQRLALTKNTTPEKIEQDLCALYPESDWILASSRLVLHGRYVCTARAPRCAECPLNEVCPSRQVDPKGSWGERARAEALEMESRAEGFRRAVQKPS